MRLAAGESRLDEGLAPRMECSVIRALRHEFIA
jgi:hypothetical protein